MLPDGLSSLQWFDDQLFEFRLFSLLESAKEDNEGLHNWLKVQVYLRSSELY
jgi:hypothetical protein